MKQQGHILIILIILLTIIVGIFIYSKSNQPSIQPEKISQPTVSALKNYTSQSLKISFKYPKDWYMDDRYQKVLISNYQTSLNQNNQPKGNEIAVTIKHASLCQKTLDEDVLLGGCGEGQNSKNEILSKDTKNVSSGSFIIYKIKYPTGQKDTFYYLEKGNQILQISKQPYPSQFEKEFEDLINSIEFK